MSRSKSQGVDQSSNCSLPLDMGFHPFFFLTCQDCSFSLFIDFLTIFPLFFTFTPETLSCLSSASPQTRRVPTDQTQVFRRHRASSNSGPESYGLASACSSSPRCCLTSPLNPEGDRSPPTAVRHSSFSASSRRLGQTRSTCWCFFIRASPPRVLSSASLSACLSLTSPSTGHNFSQGFALFL
ncbi:hypothetical protein RchiOBHm_Chr1g0314851 [Rosa chinensis]|uniref:Uncharacterized protein n=1 Tax=Rosa chinensis TaxID=74649 RepID=A0A2P6S776_ROSCH|nr:hypothetical protein RchiOBHm_Chr1g0314851 [Rosa chinensis]